MTLPFDLVPYDNRNGDHVAYVFDTFRHSTSHWPWNAMSRPMLQERLRQELAAPGTDTRIATPHGMPDSFLGWYSVRGPETVVYAFTRYSARRQGIASQAVTEMGLCSPVGLVFWTSAAARMNRYSRWAGALYFDTREAYDDDPQGR